MKEISTPFSFFFLPRRRKEMGEPFSGSHFQALPTADILFMRMAWKLTEVSSRIH